MELNIKEQKELEQLENLVKSQVEYTSPSVFWGVLINLFRKDWTQKTPQQRKEREEKENLNIV